MAVAEETRTNLGGGIGELIPVLSLTDLEERQFTSVSGRHRTDRGLRGGHPVIHGNYPQDALSGCTHDARVQWLRELPSGTWDEAHGSGGGGVIIWALVASSRASLATVRLSTEPA